MRTGYIIFSILLFSTLQVCAYHIIGGEIYYRHISGNTYEITLKLYRDCNSSGATFDDEAHLAAFDMNGNRVKTFTIDFPIGGSDPLALSNNSPCLQYPPNLCIEEAVYKKEISFTQIPPGGLTIVYQRCCRNNTIANIVNPAEEGVTYFATIPDPGIGVKNSSPSFNEYPSLIACAGSSLSVNSSATDPDGDSLVYELATPVTGGSQNEPMPIIPDKPPYIDIQFKSPYDLNNIIGGNPALAIDAHTGQLTGSPTDIGQFIISIAVKEFRGGVQIGEIRRDFQLNVVACNPTVKAVFNPTQNNIKIGSDTLVVCDNLKIDFMNTSIGEKSRLWNFGDYATTSDTSRLKNPSYTYPDTGVYKISLVVNPGTDCTDTLYRYLFLQNGLRAVFSTPPACEKVPVLLTDQSVAYSGIVTAWRWGFGNGKVSLGKTSTPIFDKVGLQKVTLSVTSSKHCVADTTLFITVHAAPSVSASPRDTTVCKGDPVNLHASTSTGLAYIWNSAGGIIDDANVQNPIVRSQKTESYIVSVPSRYGCIGKDTIEVKVIDTMIAAVSADTTICAGSPLRLHAANGLFYKWRDGDSEFSNNSSVNVAPFITSQYFVRTSTGSCFDLDTINVSVLTLPPTKAGLGGTINQGDQVFLGAFGAKIYTWAANATLSAIDVENPVASPLNTTTYYVMGQGENGCRASDSVVIFVTHNHQLFIPNAFSPNEDGVNDNFSFYSKGIQNIESVRIYNRYGEMIFQSEGSEKGWDGRYRNTPQQLGMYVYIIQARTYDGDIITEKGNLTLLR